MNTNYEHPEDIAQALCKVTGVTGEAEIKDCTESLYQLHAIAQNKYNSDFYRTFYVVLSTVMLFRRRNQVMAKTAFKQPNILTIEFRQERGDPDYGSCLWANFNFDLERYELTIMSDCGNYAYGWVQTPQSESFMHLMARLDWGYLLDKIASRNQVDDEATFANVKTLIADWGIDPDNPEDLEEYPELDMDRVESACNGYTQSEVYQSLLKAFDGTPLEDCDGYDVICCVEMDFTANAKKIARVFVDFIQPLCKEWLAKHEPAL